MRKYIASGGAEVIGSAMKNWFVGLNRDEYMPLIKPTLRRYGILDVRDDRWYPHQYSLDVFKIIAESGTNPAAHLVSLGMAYVETATFPPEINDTSSALLLLPQIYHLNIRNIPEHEGYEVALVAENHIQIRDRNPFPHDTVYGFIWGIARRFRAREDNFATLKRTFFNPADPDSDGALYDVMVDLSARSGSRITYAA
jgi:hypothetical protein